MNHIVARTTPILNSQKRHRQIVVSLEIAAKSMGLKPSQVREKDGETTMTRQQSNRFLAFRETSKRTTLFGSLNQDSELFRVLLKSA